MRSPRIEEWKIVSRRELPNAKCARRANGIAFDGSSWFIAACGTGDAFEGGGLYKIDIQDMEIVYADFPTSGVHFGGMDFYGGYLYVAVGERDIWGVDAELKTPRKFRLPAEGHPGPNLPWCSINPLNGLLYTSPFNGVDQLYAYDPADGFAYRGSMRLRCALSLAVPCLSMGIRFLGIGPESIGGGRSSSGAVDSLWVCASSCTAFMRCMSSSTASACASSAYAEKRAERIEVNAAQLADAAVIGMGICGKIAEVDVLVVALLDRAPRGRGIGGSSAQALRSQLGTFRLDLAATSSVISGPSLSSNTRRLADGTAKSHACIASMSLAASHRSSWLMFFPRRCSFISRISSPPSGSGRQARTNCGV